MKWLETLKKPSVFVILKNVLYEETFVENKS